MGGWLKVSAGKFYLVMMTTMVIMVMMRMIIKKCGWYRAPGAPALSPAGWPSRQASLRSRNFLLERGKPWKWLRMRRVRKRLQNQIHLPELYGSVIVLQMFALLIF